LPPYIPPPCSPMMNKIYSCEQKERKEEKKRKKKTEKEYKTDK
jgi:hypothetical protein